MKDSSEKLHRLKSYLYQVMGFFVVEDTILHTTQGLITREILDGWWAMVLTQMVTLLRTACVSVHHGALDCVWGGKVQRRSASFMSVYVVARHFTV